MRWKSEGAGLLYGSYHSSTVTLKKLCHQQNMSPTKYVTTHGSTKNTHCTVWYLTHRAYAHNVYKSRYPFYRHVAEHHNCDHDIIEAWNKEWTKHQRPKQLTITPDTTAPPGSDLPRKLWVILNRLRAGVGRFGAEMHKWGLRTSASCACGAATQMRSISCSIAISFVNLTPSRTSLT